jgi:SSS family solute:Na+ symporter
MEGFSYESGSFFWIMNNLYFQYYSLVIFLVCIVVMIVVSYVTQAPSYERISGLTFSTMTDEHKKESRASWTITDVTTSALVLVLILAAYLYFSG